MKLDLRQSDPDLYRQPGLWRGRPHKPANQTEMIEQWSPVVIAWCVEHGLVDGWPLTMTARGWRWLAARHRGVRHPLIGIEEAS